MALRLADGLSLPTAAATETFLIVGKRGSGKSSTATRLAEQFIRSNVPIAVLDPVDVWWGLKAGADGTREGGLEVYVFGGEHAELPLEPTAGKLMADTIVDHRINGVFVLRQFSNREKAAFVSDFADQLFKRNRSVLHLFCEEAHETMPQNPYGGEEEMLGRMIRLVKLGRTSGIGVTAVTQRPASLNKNVTTQCEVLVAHRTLGAQDRDALDDWIKYHRLQEQRAEFLASLGELKTGEAWFWAPDFPEDKPLGLRRVQVAMPETFDSRRTPKPGEKRKEPKSLAPVDLAKLGEKMAATRERAKQTDPKILQGRVRELEAALSRATPTVKLTERRVEVAVLKDAQIARLERVLASFDKLTSRFSGVTADMAEAVQPVYKAIQSALNGARSTGSELAPVRAAVRAPVNGAGRAEQGSRTSVGVHTDRPARAGVLRTAVPPTQTARTIPSDGEPLTSAQQKILNALAWLSSVGKVEASREAIGALAGFKPTSGTFGVHINRLQLRGLVTYPIPGHVGLTEAGLHLAEAPDHPLTTRELHEALYNKLPAAQGGILRELIKERGEPIARADLAQRVGASPTSGTFGVHINRLYEYGFATYPRPGYVAAADVLFLDRAVA